jgi:hypothetical protein
LIAPAAGIMLRPPEVGTLRTVEVRFERGSGSPTRLSAGYLVNRSTVLTCAHALDYQAELDDGQSLKVSLVEANDYHEAEPWYVGTKDVDLAVLTIKEALLDETLPQCDQAAFGIVRRNSPFPLEKCWAVGFPTFNWLDSVPDSVEAWGAIVPGSGLNTGMLALHVSNGPAESAHRPVMPHESVSLTSLVNTGWSGMSGAVVFHWDGVTHRIVGVAMEHRPAGGMSTLIVAPITLLDTLGETDRDRCWEQLHRGGNLDIIALPVEEVPTRAPQRTYQRSHSSSPQFDAMSDVLADLLAKQRGPALRRLAREFDVRVKGPDGKRRNATPDDFADVAGRERIAMLAADMMYSDGLDLRRIASVFSAAAGLVSARAELADLVAPFKDTVPDAASASLAAFYADEAALTGRRQAWTVIIQTCYPWYAYWHLVRARAGTPLPRAVELFPGSYGTFPDSQGAGRGKDVSPSAQIWRQIREAAGGLDERPELVIADETAVRRGLYGCGDATPVAVLWARPGGAAVDELAAARARYARLLFFVVFDPEGRPADGVEVLDARTDTEQRSYLRLYNEMSGGEPLIPGSLGMAKEDGGHV